jgi:hypothetical protein
MQVVRRTLTPALTCFAGGLAACGAAGSSGSPHGAAEAGVLHDGSPPVEDTGAPVKDSSGKADAPTLPTVCKAPSTLPFTPALHARPSASLCTPDIFDSLFSACFDQATQSASGCSAAQEAYPGSMACFTQCMTTQFTPANAAIASDVWGGVVVREDQPGIYFFDIGGCVAALDRSPAGQRCAKDFEAQLECQTLSCNACVVPAAPSEAQVHAYDTCEMAAPCDAYVRAGGTDCASNAGPSSHGPAAACLQASVTLTASTTTAAEATAAIRTVLAAVCAPGVLTEDAGTDGGGGG